MDKKMQLQNSNDVYQIMQKILLRENKIGRNKEHVWVISLSLNKVLLNIELISLGTNKATAISPTNVYQLAVHKEAEEIIMVHNHPDGILEPSFADKHVTDRMIKVGEILNIFFSDHLIISEKNYYSFLNSGLLRELQQSTKYALDFVQAEAIKEDSERLGRLVGRKEGKAEGIEIGRAGGRAEGIKIGRTEIAKNLKKIKLSAEKICKITGLSEEEINKIR